MSNISSLRASIGNSITRVAKTNTLKTFYLLTSVGTKNTIDIQRYACFDTGKCRISKSMENVEHVFLLRPISKLLDNGSIFTGRYMVAIISEGKQREIIFRGPKGDVWIWQTNKYMMQLNWNHIY